MFTNRASIYVNIYQNGRPVKMGTIGTPSYVVCIYLQRGADEDGPSGVRGDVRGECQRGELPQRVSLAAHRRAVFTLRTKQVSFTYCI